MSKFKDKSLKTALAIVLVFFVNASAFAAIDQVRCILWQGDTTKYHTAIIDEPVTLRAVITTTNGDPIEYKWVFNDGTADSDVVELSGNTKYNITIDHTFVGLPGTPFTAQLVVMEPSEELARAAVTVTDNYLVKLEQDSTNAQVNIAIEKALWRLYTWMNYYDGVTDNTYKTMNGQPLAFWPWYYHPSATASVVQAFMINNHKETGNFSEDPYAEAVKWGLNWLFNGLYNNYEVLDTMDVSAQQGTTDGDPPLPAYAEDYDNDGDVDDADTALGANTIGIDINENFAYDPPYHGGMIIDAIISTGTPNADTGRDFDQDGNTDTYKAVVQDMIDAYAWGQNNDGTYGEGSWRYDWDIYGATGIDNSCAQWAAIGIIPAEDEWGCYLPQWVKTRNDTSLNNSYTTFGPSETPDIYGRFGYTNANCYWTGSVANGCHATTPSGMVMMIMDGFSTDDERWQKCERWLADNWEDWLAKNYLYGYFAFVKSMRLAKPFPIETFAANGVNWYYGGTPIPLETRQEPVKGLAERLIELQQADGQWDDYWVSDAMPTSWGVIILKPALFRAAPIACFTVSPNPTYADRDVTFDPFCSDHSETGKGLVNLRRFDWDWDNNGTYDETTFSPVKVQHSFPCEELPCSYPVKLRVTDDEGLSATTTRNVDITLPPHPPVANAGGPYMVSLCPGDELILDGSESLDPNEGEKEPDCGECPLDTITAYDWDLIGPQLTEFDDAQGATVDIDPSNNLFFDGPGMYNIALQVTDNTALSYPGSGQDNLTDVDFTSVDMYEGCICDITADPGCNTANLSWTPVDGADEYIIFRSIRGINSGFVELTTTENTSINIGIVRDMVNYYRVMAVVGNDKCLSKAVAVESDPATCSGNLQVSAGRKEEDYVMVSFPIDCDNPDAVSVLGLPVSTRNLRFGTYDPNAPPPDGTGAYIEYGNNLTIEKGRAYFILSRNALDILIDCNPASLEEDVEVPLWYNPANQNGWNQIGPPNESDYEWDEVQVMVKDENGAIIFGPVPIKDLPAINDYIDKKLWAYQPDGTYDSNTEILRVKKGYFVKAKQANVWLLFPRSAQLLVDASKRDVMFARLIKSGRHFLEKYIFSPNEAYADTDDYPPRPIGALADEETSAVSTGSCFIESANQQFPVRPKALIPIVLAVTMIGFTAACVFHVRRKND